MKIINYIYTILFISVLGILGGCQDFLDTVPDNRTEIDSEAKITSLLVSAYPTKIPILINEMASDNVMDNGTLHSYYPGIPEQQEAYLWDHIQNTGNSDEPSDIWEECYRAIGTANQVLEAIEELGNPESLSAQMGEALLCRAYSHFILVNTFCQHYNIETSETDLGIPYVTKTEKEIFVDYERGTVAGVYKKIDDDIEKGLPLIDDNLYTVPKYHFNSAAAFAFAARFNLFYCNYSKVIDYATRAIGVNPSSKLRNYTPLSNAAGYEDISNLYIAADEPANLMLLPLYSSYGYVYGAYNNGKRYGHSNEIRNTETYGAPAVWGRASLVYNSMLYIPYEKLNFPKLDTYFEYTDKASGIGYRHIVHTAFTVDETLLCRAEAYILTNQFSNALTDIQYWLNTHLESGYTISQARVNTFYNSITDYVSVDVTSEADRGTKKKLNPKGITIASIEQENMIHLILHLRRIETLFEGQRWYDIKRYGIEYSHNRANRTNDILTVDDPRRAFQIPDDAITMGLPANPR